MVVAQGLDAREVRVELVEQKVNEADGTAGSGTVVATQQLAIPEAGGRLRVQFSHSVKESGNILRAILGENIGTIVHGDEKAE